MGGEHLRLTLSENIRTLRKERSLTQEQLSEVLGVTAMDAIQNVVNEYEKEAFTALWESVRNEEEPNRG